MKNSKIRKRESNGVRMRQKKSYFSVLSVHELNTEIAKSRGKFFGASERDPIGVRCDLSV